MEISHIIKDIDGDFSKVNIYFPSLESNFDVVENNICHNNEKLYDHVIQVYKNIIEIYNEINNKEQLEIDLLKLSIIFHDVGKIKVIKKDFNGVTSCPNHELESLNVFRQNIKNIQGLSKDEIFWIEKFIANHSEIHLVCDEGPEKFEHLFGVLVNKFPSMYKEMLLFGYCDLYKSYLMISDPNEYEYRIGSFRRKITDLYL